MKLPISIVSRAVVEKEVQLGELIAIPLNPPLTRSLYFVFPQDRFQSRLAATFIEFAKKKLKEIAL